MRAQLVAARHRRVGAGRSTPAPDEGDTTSFFEFAGGAVQDTGPGELDQEKLLLFKIAASGQLKLKLAYTLDKSGLPKTLRATGQLDVPRGGRARPGLGLLVPAVTVVALAVLLTASGGGTTDSGDTGPVYAALPLGAAVGAVADGRRRPADPR